MMPITSSGFISNVGDAIRLDLPTGQITARDQLVLKTNPNLINIATIADLMNIATCPTASALSRWRSC
jgi:hypothetical protein